MQTVLYVSGMELGDEVAVRAAHDAFPAEALQQGLGLDRLVVFIGSGFYAMEITVGDGDFQENLRRFIAAPEVRRLFDALRPYVKDLPEPESTTAEMPLATAMLIWQADGRTDSTSV